MAADLLYGAGEAIFCMEKRKLLAEPAPTKGTPRPRILAVLEGERDEINVGEKPFPYTRTKKMK